MADGLFLPFEQVLLRQALEKHVHRSDTRKGITCNRRAVYGGSYDVKADEQTEKQDFHHDSVQARGAGKLPDSTNRKELARPKSPKDARAFAGTMDLIAPKFGASSVRCRISKCINLVDPNSEEVKKFLRSNCGWRPMPLQALGGAVQQSASPSHPATPIRLSEMVLPVRERPLSGNLSQLAAQTSTFSGKFRKSIYRGNKFSEEGSFDVVPWEFIRHFPILATGDLNIQEKGNITGRVFTLDTHLEVLFSDVSALLKDVCGDTLRTSKSKEQFSDAMPVLDFLMQVPKVTHRRWWRMLRPHDHHENSLASLAKFLALALAAEPTQFKVVNEEGTSHPSSGSLLQLCKQDDAEKQKKARGGKSPEENSDVPRDAREFRFCRIMHMLKSVADIEARVGGMWDLGMEDDRFQIIACALDRAESLRLRGGLTAAQDRIHCHGERSGAETDAVVGRAEMKGSAGRAETKASAGPRARRGRKITVDWLLVALAEASDDEFLEDGDSVRLLVEVSHPSFAPPQQPQVSRSDNSDASKEYSPSSQTDEHAPEPPQSSPNGKRASVPGTRNIQASVRPSVAFEQAGQVQFNEDCWKSLCRSLGLLHKRTVSSRTLPDVENEIDENNSETASMGPQGSLSSTSIHRTPLSIEIHGDDNDMHTTPQADCEEAVFEALEDFYQVVDIVHQCLGRVDNLGMTKPFVLESLLHHAAHNWPGHTEDEMVPGGSRALVAHLLWERCGWDTPVGRRLIRRLCVVFNKFQHEGRLSRHNFLKMCYEAGLVAKRNMSAANARLWKIFSEVVENREFAQFPELITLIEQVAYWRSSSVDVNHIVKAGGGGLVIIPGEARHWPCIEHVVLQLLGSHDAPSAPEWFPLHHRHQEQHHDVDAHHPGSHPFSPAGSHESYSSDVAVHSIGADGGEGSSEQHGASALPYLQHLGIHLLAPAERGSQSPEDSHDQASQSSPPTPMGRSSLRPSHRPSALGGPRTSAFGGMALFKKTDSLKVPGTPNRRPSSTSKKSRKSDGE